MAKYELRLSGGASVTAIGSLRLTRLCNDSQDLSLGSACAAMLELTLYGAVAIEAGTELTCLEEGEQLGIFYCETPRRTGRNTLSVTAYDRMVCFDRDISGWLARQSFPTDAQSLLEALCAHCGVPLSEETALPEFLVQAFSQPGLTGRQLLQYLGQLSGRFFRVNAQGVLEAGWYTPSGLRLGEALPIRMDSLSCADYTAAPIERVLIRASENDTGAVWPDGSAEEANTYILQGNPLLPPSADRQGAAKRLYEQLKDYVCTPFSCTLLPGGQLQPGQTVTFADPSGVLHTAPVMEMTIQNGQRSIKATGSSSLQSTTAFNHLMQQSIPGRVLTVERTAEGLKAENTDIRGNAATLALTVEGITARVSSAEEKAGDYASKSQLSVLEQKADGLSLSVTQLWQHSDTKADQSQLTELTEHFLFGADGLTISNTATGMGMGISERQIAFTGGSSPTTVITPNAMETTSLHIGTRLDVGNFSLLPRANQNLSLRYTAQ